MDKILKEVRKSQRRNPNLHVAYDGLYCYIHALSNRQCSFCLGFAHTAKHCQSKKELDSICKRVPEWKMAWGTVKAVAKGRGVMEGVSRAQAGIQ